MIWATNKYKEGIRKLASPQEKGFCPSCGEEVISKCGEIKIWHWAHKSNFECDDWYEPESKWHIDWKNNFSKERQEIIIGKHRADIKTKKGIVIELQNSFISSQNIEEREEFYGNMIWLINGETLCNGIELRKRKDIVTFRWKHPPKSWWNAFKPIYIDFGTIIFQVKRIYPNIPCGGWGELITKEEFLKRFR